MEREKNMGYGIKAIIDSLPEDIQNHIASIRKDYKNDALDKDEVRNYARGYTHGLRDAGLITERGRQHLIVYLTL